MRRPFRPVMRALVVAVFGLLLLNTVLVNAGSAPGFVPPWSDADLVPESIDSGTPPVNDDFANASVISTLPFSDVLTAKGAQRDGPLTCGGRQGTVWYRFTATTDSTIVVDTFGSDYNTYLAVYAGESLATLTEIVCNGRAGPGPFGTEQSRWSLRPEPGTTYYFRVALFGQETAGSLIFNARGAAPPPNDDLVDALVIPSLPFSESLSTDFATLEPGEQQPICTSHAASTVWYSLTPSEDLLIVADTTGSDYKTFLAVWAEGPSGLTEVICTTGLSRPNARLAVKAVAGQTYHFQVGGFSFREQVGTLVFNLSVGSRPPNDNVADATIVTALPFEDSVDSVVASTEPNEPECDGTRIVASVWYRYTATEATVLVVDTVGSEFHFRAVGVYVEDELGDLTAIECFAPSRKLGFIASAGTTYVFQMGSLPTFPSVQRGHLSFALESLPVPSCPEPQFSVPDPVGDFDVTGHPHDVPDLVSVSGAESGDNFCVDLEFAEAVEPPSANIGVATFAWLVFDTDENPRTGSELAAFESCGTAVDLGVDLRIDTSGAAGVLLPLYQPGVPDAIISFGERSFTIAIPRSALGDGPPFNFAVMAGSLHDPLGKPFFLIPNDCAPNGEFIHWPPAFGDANCNGTVNAIDATLVLQLDGGLIGSLPCDVGDVDENNRVDAVDASLILQKDAGLICCLPP